MILIDQTAPAAGLAPETASADALAADALARRLDGEIGTHEKLEDRIRIIKDAIPGRVAFSSSLGIEDQAVTHAIATTGAGIDIFTLDTGRHFSETYDTLFETEGRYGTKIRVMYPDAK